MRSKVKRSADKRITEKIKKWFPFFIGFTAIISVSLVIVINIDINVNIDFDATYIISFLTTILVMSIIFFMCILFGPTLMEQIRSKSHD